MQDDQSGTMEQAGTVARELGDAVGDRAAELRQEGTSRLRSELDTRTTQVGGQARSLAQALRESGGRLSQEGNEQLAGVTSGVADRMEQFAGYLERMQGAELLDDAERVARRSPWLVAGAAAVVGLAASRFLKASSETRLGSIERDGHPVSMNLGAERRAPSTRPPASEAPTYVAGGSAVTA